MEFATTSRSLARARRCAIWLGTALSTVVTAATFAIAAETPADPQKSHHGSAGAGASVHSPYASVPSTRDTGLLPQEVEGLRKGEGMALALPAELNGYPGPRHLLDATGAGQLELRPEQREAIQRIYDRMLVEAKAKGQEIIRAEGHLAMRFRNAHIDAAALRDLVDRIGHLRAELRFIHLHTHLETKALLTPEQIARYNALRGYNTSGGSHQHGN